MFSSSQRVRNRAPSTRLKLPTAHHAFVSPFANASNPFNESQKSLLRAVGYSVHPFSVRTLFSAKLPLLFDRRNLVVLNWMEARAFRSVAGHAVLSVSGLLILTFYLAVLLLIRARVLYFVHNHFVHDTEGGHRQFSARLIALLGRVADLRGVLDPTATDRYRAHFLPHPLLGPSPSAATPQASGGTAEADSPPQYLIVGAVRRYKALHDVLAHWPQGVSLTIAGRADPAYADELRAVIVRRNLHPQVKLEIGFISDDDLHRRIRQAGALILPHQPGSALVSSAFFEAIGRARRIVARRTPFLDWAAARLPGIACFDTDAELASLVAAEPPPTSAPISAQTQDSFDAASQWFGFEACVSAYRQALAPDAPARK